MAEKIGVSKTAIYRHFKNRAEIEDTMEERLFRDLLAVIENSEFTPESLRQTLFAFFKTHPGHHFLMLHNNLAKPDFENTLLDFLEKNSVKVATFSQYRSTLPSEKQNFLKTAILKNIVSLLLASFQIRGIEEMQILLLSVLGPGIPKLPQPTDKRLDELEKICRIDPSEMNRENKLFNAIADTIREHGIENTTIEKIAGKMGTAKSSLYFYFENKDSMLHELIRRETDTIIALCSRRAEEGKTLAEQLFIVMAVQGNYLLANLDLLAVFNWIHFETARPPSKTGAMHFDLDTLIKPYHMDELFPPGNGQKARAVGLLKWISILSTSVIIQGLKERKNEEKQKKDIRSMYLNIINGDTAC